ncbi:MAG: heparan-alpha-glucosaminide N-acetyltransferase domain-containing protein [Bacteroidota bacterium]
MKLAKIAPLRSVQPSGGRLVFIDLLRAFAILMMLQGHFVDVTLSDSARDLSHPVYALWLFMRGLTAPVFFSITGLVFAYLLLRDGRPAEENIRWQKGVRRGGMLVVLGTLLKINVFVLLAGFLPAWYYSLDVLHCIGIGLLGVCGLYVIAQELRIKLWPLFLALGTAIFLLEPVRMGIDWSTWPTIIANFWTRDFGSQFTIFPWLGYVFIGAAIGQLLHARPSWAFGIRLPLVVAALGYALCTLSGAFLMVLYQYTDWSVFKGVANYNYLFYRLGQVFICFAIFMFVIPRIPKIPRLFTKIGTETLTIYCVHYVILYGTWSGLGISFFFKDAFSGWAAGIGAASFVAAHVLMIYHIEPIRAFVYAIPGRVITRAKALAGTSQG